MPKNPETYNKALAIINGYEPEASNAAIRKSVIEWLQLSAQSDADIAEEDSLILSDQILLPDSETLNLIVKSILDKANNSLDSKSDEQYIKYIELLVENWPGKFILNFNPTQEWSENEIAVFETTLKANAAFCDTVDELTLNVPFNCNMIKDFNNLSHLALSNNNADSVNYTPNVIINTLDLSQFHKLKEISFYNLAFFGGWPKLPANGVLINLNLDFSLMLYPPINLPQSLQHLSLRSSNLVTLPNISSAKLPNLQQLQCYFDMQNQNLTIATWIALKALQSTRGLVKCWTSTNDSPLIEQPLEFILSNNRGFDTTALSDQILNDHFMALSTALIDSIDNQTFDLPKVSDEVLFKLLILACKSNIPTTILNTIFAYCDLTPQQHLAEHLQMSAIGLQDMLQEGGDVASITVLEKYKKTQLNAQLRNAKQQLRSLPGFKKYQEDYEKIFAATTQSTAVSAAIAELNERRLANENNMPRKPKRISCLFE